MRTALRSISAAGCVLFLVLSAATFVGPQFVERQAKEYVLQRMQAEALQRYPALSKVGGLLSALCKHDCAQPSIWTGVVRAAVKDRLGDRLDRLQGWARSRFDGMIDRLLRDVRIFAVTNALMFLLAFLATSVDPAPRGLTLVSGALIAGAGVGTGLYVFAQDWFHTILFSDYVGWGYAVWVALIVAAELDILLNRGRVLGAVMEGIATAISAITT